MSYKDDGIGDGNRTRTFNLVKVDALTITPHQPASLDSLNIGFKCAPSNLLVDKYHL